MSGHFENRVARNESVFRDLNERIEAGTLPADATKLATFCCECAMLGCNTLVEVTIGTYESVRANPRRFLLATGHAIPGVEAVVQTGTGWVVVEKEGEAGGIAVSTDPRSG
jgi:hypothetical protein